MATDDTKPQGYLIDADSPPAADDAKLREKTAVLRVTYKDPAGRVFDGEITNQILTVGQRIKVDVARAQQAGGVSPESMTVRAYGLLYALCWLEQSIVAGPQWSKNLNESLQEGLVGAIWDQVDRHERTFFGGRSDSGTGQS